MCATSNLMEEQMIDKDPSTFSAITYAWVIFISAWGGAVSFITKLKTGRARAFNIVEFIGEIFISAFSGLLTFYLCESANIDKLHEIVLVAISGHMGARVIFMIEKAVEKRINTVVAVVDGEIPSKEE